jgi:hypothetical protein
MQKTVSEIILQALGNEKAQIRDSRMGVEGSAGEAESAGKIRVKIRRRVSGYNLTGASLQPGVYSHHGRNRRLSTGSSIERPKPVLQCRPASCGKGQGTQQNSNGQRESSAADFPPAVFFDEFKGFVNRVRFADGKQATDNGEYGIDIPFPFGVDTHLDFRIVLADDLGVD